MPNVHKYLTLKPDVEDWGIQVLNAGCAQIHPSEPYPSPVHPDNHYFDWDRGRTLHNCYVVYITQGKGYFQSSQQRPVPIEAGTIIMLYPGQWHSYKPDEVTGWEEYWVGFNGLIIRDLIDKHYFNPANPLLKIGMHDQVLRIFQHIIDTVQNERPGYQPLACGAILHLLGAVHAYSRGQMDPDSGSEEALIQKAKMRMLSDINSPLCPKTIADDLNVGYDWFRKEFKARTGLAPKQYIIQLKIERAIQLLDNPSKSIKEVAYELSFESAFYFSTFFKKKMGVSPEGYRARLGQSV